MQNSARVLHVIHLEAEHRNVLHNQQQLCYYQNSDCHLLALYFGSTCGQDGFYSDQELPCNTMCQFCEQRQTITKFAGSPKWR